MVNTDTDALTLYYETSVYGLYKSLGWEALKVFVESGGNLNAKNQFGNTPLHSAVSQDDCFLVKTLLELGADPNVANRRGRTALHFSIMRNNYLALKTLLEYGADPMATDNRLWTALHILASYMDCDTSILCALLKYGANPNAQNEDFNTPLHIAAGEGRVEIVEVLLRC